MENNHPTPYIFLKCVQPYVKALHYMNYTSSNCYLDFPFTHTPFYLTTQPGLIGHSACTRSSNDRQFSTLVASINHTLTRSLSQSVIRALEKHQ